MGHEQIVSLSKFKKESFVELSTLMEDLDAHNFSYGDGARAGKMMSLQFQSRAEHGEINTAEVHADVAIETAQGARVALAQFRTKHGGILNRFGLTLAHYDAEGLRRGLPAGTLSLKVADADRFLRSIRTLATVYTTGDTSRMCEMLLTTIENQVKTATFSGFAPEDSGVRESLDSMCEVLKRLAPDLDTSRLQHYADFQKSGQLEQYLVAYKNPSSRTPTFRKN